MRYIVSNHAVWNPEGETVVVWASHQQYGYRICESGVFLWHLLSEHRSVDELVAAVSSEYVADENRLRADIETFLKELIALGFVEEYRDITCQAP